MISRLSRGTRKSTSALAVSQEEAQHLSLLLRARRATLVVVDLRTIKGHCTNERPLSFGSQLW